jgi:hypothetical protein
MTYITREDVRSTLVDMQSFYQELKHVFQNAGMNIEDNLGRRNILMSQVQEEFLARALSKRYENVIADGSPGKADIFIADHDREIECKLTTVNKSGAISLQSDYETLKQKGSLDYVYFVASPDFESFAVLYFQSLTVDDFRPLSNGSRGKVAMKKHEGMKKVDILWGGVQKKNDLELEKLTVLFEKEAELHRTNMHRVSTLKKDITQKISTRKHPSGREMSERDLASANSQFEKIFARQDRERSRHSKKVNGLLDRKTYWLSQPGKYSFLLEKVSHSAVG